MKQTWQSRLSDMRNIAAIVGMTILLAGAIWGSFVWASTRMSVDDAAKAHEKIRLEGIEERKVLRIEAATERTKMNNDIKATLDKHHGEVREDFKYVQDQINAVFQEVRRKNGHE